MLLSTSQINQFSSHSFNVSTTTLFTRFQKLFASFALYVSIACLLSKSQSCHILKLDNKYNTNISFEYSSENSTGSITLPSDFEIFCQSTVKNHVVSICFGNSYPALISIAGQYIA
jgi:hypothetical protein